ncbi:lysosomal amino acid transporter 1 homolog isoform X2 [Brachyhypopomus gauderio]
MPAVAPFYQSSGDTNMSSLCPNGTKWIWDGLGECAQDARDIASVILGLVSLVCFILSSIPQYYRSCKTGNMDSALSIFFLLLWLAGDTCNLIGSFLAQQLPLQIYTAVYYVAADLLMMSMYLYYSMKHRVAINRNRRLLNAVGVLYVLGFSASLLQLAPAPDPALNPALGSALNPGRAPGPGRTLLCVVERQDISIQPFTTKEIIGFVIGSLSSLLYLCSRLPQIYTNFKRKSTEGLSYFLFALVILGNSTYGLSVLIKNPDMGTGEVSYMVHHLPWLIGSLGTLLLDLVITVQFVKYRRPSQESCPVDEEAAALLSS